jgi:hypothetical protein
MDEGDNKETRLQESPPDVRPEFVEPLPPGTLGGVPAETDKV